MNTRKIDIFDHDISRKLDRKKSDKPCSILVPSKIFTQEYINKKSIGYKITRLHKLIADPITRENNIWIDRLLNSCLREIRHQGYKLKYLSAVIDVLQFLSWKSYEISEYKRHFNDMIDLCAYSPLLESFTENSLHSETLENYFTVLGYLTILLPCQDQVINILKSFNKLLRRSTLSNNFAIKFENCRQSIEKSELPSIFVKFIEICPPTMYTKVLDTTYILASISKICCHKMLKAGILNHLLSRMNEQSFLDIVVQLEQESININENIIVINILLLLMNSIFPPQTLNITKEIISSFSVSTRSLQKIFQQVIAYSDTNCRVLIVRNNLATIFLMKLVAIPSLPIVDFDLIKEFLQIAFRREIKNNEDLTFRKLLFSTICQLSYFDGSLLIIKDCCIIEKTLQFLNQNINCLTTLQDSTNFNYLFSYSLRTLTFLVPKIPGEFIHSNAINFLNLFHSSMTGQVNCKMTFEVVKTLCSIVTFTCSNSLVRCQDVILTFLNTICWFDRLTTFHKKTSTLICITFDTIITSNFQEFSIYGNRIVVALLKLLKHCLNQKENSFITDDRLLISMGVCIWSCIIKFSVTIEKFVEMGGLYSILDLIDQTTYLVQTVYLGLLTDLCSSPHCIPHICTWRGTDKTNTLISLLIRVWKDEESRIGVKRTESGCIADVELPLMGTNQWHESFHLKINDDYSPAIATMFGFIRPKVYSIRKILLNNSELYEKSREYYKILLCNISIEDSITFCIVDQFLRFVQGQVWAEVIRYIRQSGIIPAGNDGEMLLVMRQRHRKFALYVRDRQKKILRDTRRYEDIKEQNELVKTHNVTLISTLIGFQKLMKNN